MIEDRPFDLKTDWDPAGDQPHAIEKLVAGLRAGMEHQTLLGVTGSGKTFTAANVINQIQKPTLVIAHNKTLAAQLAQEYKEFFPNNAVHYFVSYYDYYQPEAYVSSSDTYIEKEAQINTEIERLRHASTQSLLTRTDTIVVASVSCIYGLGDPFNYQRVNLRLDRGTKITRGDLLRKLIGIYYARTNADLSPGTFRAVGNAIEVMTAQEKMIFRFELFANQIDQIDKIDPVSRVMVESDLDAVFLFPAKHFVTDNEKLPGIIDTISNELKGRLAELEKENKVLEYERLKRRTTYDLALIREVGYCSGIENYSRHFDGRNEGEPAHSLLSYFPHKPDGTADFLTVIDESHVTVPQIGGMYAGDRSRKMNLVEHGFRLPSALDNRPLQFHEFEERVGQVLHVSATPGTYEKEHSEQIAEQLIRPTGLLDPVVDVRPVTPTTTYKGQIKDFIAEVKLTIKKGFRVLATTLTKQMAEDLSEYLKEQDIKAEYLHSDIKTIERIEILTSLRKGEFDVLVGVNLLREGLDLPEVALIGILDADKEGFLRSETSLVQTIGRAARNSEGRVILYADKMTRSLDAAISETNRRRTLQIAYNKEHGITPTTIKKKIMDITDQLKTKHSQAVDTMLKIDSTQFNKNPEKFIKQKEKQMNAAVKILDFETAAILRDEIEELRRRAESSAEPNKGT